MADHLHHRTIARLSIEYVAAFLCEGVAESGLGLLDFAIMLVVSAGNTGRLKGTPQARSHDHGSDRPVPPGLMTPTSLTTIVESLKLSPQEARTHVAGLVSRGILVEAGADRFITGEPVTSSGAAARLADKNVAIASRFVKQLSGAGVNA